MYQTCPKCSYKRQATDTKSTDICPACGLVFSKWTNKRFRIGRKRAPHSVDRGYSFWERLVATVFYVPPEVNSLVLAGRALLFVVFFVWGWSFVLSTMESNEIGHSFMHNVNLVFHEAGHVVFRFFGRFMMILGGSLGQLLMPAIVLVALLWKNHDPFGASIGLWWFGQSLMDLAPYINDARTGQLMLLGGVTGQDLPGVHDWFNILADLDLLQYDHRIAQFVDALGVVFMLLAFAWGGYILHQQYQRRR